MIRYVVSFPQRLTYEQVEHYRQMLQSMADSRQWKDVVLADGATITKMTDRPVSALVRRARAKAR